MSDAFSHLNGFEVFFLLCAIVGGFFVLIKLVMQFSGLDSDVDVDTDLDADLHHADSDVGFKLLSLHGLTYFLLMFGLVGFTLYRQSMVGFALSILGGSVAGLASVWVIGKLFSSFSRLQSSGTLPVSEAVGSSGTVYLTIPKGGTGRVTINFKNRLREFDAVSMDGESITTGVAVRVVRVDASILVVEKIQ